MKVETLRGFANSYLIDGYFLIDATNLSEFPHGIESVLLTHEHCDHIVGLSKLNTKKRYGSRFLAKALENADDLACL
ncbi:hypothetical protein HZC07_00210 [Candidatus Micrarchaeota archaeon]|nr:hypothetical protein [Candidatus Micrarchaeota archaeon]